MRKLLTLALAALISVSVFADGPTPNYKNYNHWMLSFGGGFNMFATEQHGTISDPVRNYRDNFTGACYLNAGYMINPAWGFVLEYGYVPISKALWSVQGDKLGQGHEVSIQMDINLLNAFQRRRNHKNWNLDMLIGGGFYAYNTPQVYDVVDGYKHIYALSLMVPVTLQVEYCPIDELGISFRATGKWYSSDGINYENDGRLTDLGLYCGLGLRYNIVTNNKKHVRVMDMASYEKRGAVERDTEESVEDKSVEELRNELAKLQNEIANLNNRVDSKSVTPTTTVNVTNTGDYDSLRTDVNEMKTDIEYIRQALMQQNGTEENAVYFETNSSRVTSSYEVTIAKVAKNMLLDKKLQLEIVAYCDKDGSVEINKKLGQERLNAVYYILVNRYRIDQNRIRTKYEGQVDDEFGAMNRRCDMIYK